MFALKSHRGEAPASGVVLPRWLRRPVRALRRLRLEDIKYPRFGASLAVGALFGFVTIYGGVKGGHVEEVVQVVTSRTGFAIDDINITGNREISEIDILQQIGLDGWTSMVGFSAELARERIAELPWVESAEIRKVYPATVEVQLVERQPFAIWQHENQLQVIERNGKPIAPFYGGRLASLPLIIGAGAEKAGPAIVEMVAGVQALNSRVTAYIRIADRRWDLRLDNGLTIKLPEVDVAAALAEAARLEAEYALFDRDVEVVDLRLGDRVTVALSPEASESHNNAFKKMMAARKKGARI